MEFYQPVLVTEGLIEISGEVRSDEARATHDRSPRTSEKRERQRERVSKYTCVLSCGGAADLKHQIVAVTQAASSGHTQLRNFPVAS